MSAPDLSSEVLLTQDSDKHSANEEKTETPKHPLSKITIDFSSFNGPLNSKVLDNYKYNFNSMQNEFSDVALYD